MMRLAMWRQVVGTLLVETLRSSLLGPKFFAEMLEFKQILQAKETYLLFLHKCTWGA
jgi:hypothetical protein